MWDLAVSYALAKEAVNPELATETVNVDELSKVIVGSYNNDTKTTNFPSSEIPLGCCEIEKPSKISPSFIISFLNKKKYQILTCELKKQEWSYNYYYQGVKMANDKIKGKTLAKNTILAEFSKWC